MKAPPSLPRFNLPLLLCLGLCSFLFFFRLGVPGLMDPDEGRYAEIAREMLVTGDFVTPHLNFLPYLEKPPLVYWLTALSLTLGGLNEWAARFIPALSALGGVLAVYWFAATLWGVGTGILAGLIIATSSGYFILGRLLTLDMALAGFMTWGLALSYLALRNQKRHYLPWAYLALGLAVLTKGPVAVVLPGLIFLAWFLALKQWRSLLQLWHPGGALILAAVVLPWYILVAWRNPNFLDFFFLQEHLQRFLTPRIHAGQPVYYYFGVLISGFLPWVFFLPWAWLASVPEPPSPAASRDRLFLLLWFGVIFIFFSLSRAKLFPYLLPGLPPLALLIARALAAVEEKPEHAGTPTWFWTLRLWLVLALLSSIALTVTRGFFPSYWQKISFLAPYIMAYLLILAMLPGVLLAGLPSPRYRRHLLLGGAVLLNLVLLFGVEPLAETRSPKPLAQVINSHRQPDSIIVGFLHYSQGMSFYTGQPLYLFQTRGELEFGLQQEADTPYYLGEQAQLSELLSMHPDFFLLINREHLEFFQTIYGAPVTILTQWKNYLLVTRP